MTIPRRPIAIANWKMAMTIAESLAFIENLQTLASLELVDDGYISVAGTLPDPSVLDGAPFFNFNVARDLEISLDTGTLEIRGVYILDGYGGIHATGNAPTISDAPFFGFDVARDLELFHFRQEPEEEPGE